MHGSEELVEYMSGVQAAQRDLRDLAVVWQMIESSAAISCPEDSETVLPTLVRTRERFDELQARLVAEMAEESRAALGDQLSAKAQCAIDILVRNLFERTADVGFLATDDDIRVFCALDDAQRDVARAAMVRRLGEYQAKYTVYDEVMLLSPQGQVLACLDAARLPVASSDPVVAEALAAGGHVECFRRSDLAADAAPALMYAHRIASRDGRVLGVLVLRFRFVDEMHYVFASMADERHEIALLLVDAKGQCIVSNDEAHVPVGAKLLGLPTGRVGLTSFAGREYLAVSCASPGYQGYAGPPWRAVAMVSLMTAFRHRGAVESAADADVPLDNRSLREIVDSADDINRDLRRVVWNGQLQASVQGGDSRRLKAVLHQVDRAGRRTRERVARAIVDLHRASLARTRHQVGDLARLAADIMDRNLYERANDCRWWALSPALRTLLAEPPGDSNAAAINALLDHVNGLYTVYSRLVAFDAQGRIRGASQLAGDAGLIGSAVEPAWVDAVSRLRGTQAFHVSAFGDTPLHAHGATYVYMAAVHDPRDEALARGGIAIVFHAGRELKAMLGDVFGERTGVAAFVDESGQVLAATDADLARGVVAASSAGQGLVEVGGVHYACAHFTASGYREFKTCDGYDNGVRALVALRLGSSERRQTAFSDVALAAATPPSRGRSLELAVFQVGPMRCALPTHDLVDARPASDLIRVPAGLEPAVGVVDAGGGRLVPVLRMREAMGIRYAARRTDGMLLMVSAGAGEGAHEKPEAAFGLLIDDVLAVLEVDPASLHDGPSGFRRFMPWLVGVLDTHAPGVGTLLVQVLDAGRIRADCGLPRGAEPEALPPQAGTLGSPASAMASSASS